MRADLFRLPHGSALREFTGIPGPTPTFPLGTARQLMVKEPWDVVAGYGRVYGGMTLLWLMGTPAIALNDAELIGEVLDTNSDAYYKKDPTKALLPITGPHSLFLANGAEWKKRRQDYPFLAPDVDGWLAGQVPQVRELISDRLAELAGSSGEAPSVNLLESMQRLAFDALCLATFGEQPGDTAYDDFVYLAGVGTRRMLLPVIPSHPLSPFFSSRLARWRDAISSIVKERQANLDAGANDLISLVLRGSHELPAEQIGELADNAIFAGVFSMTSVVLSSLYYLAKSENVHSWLADERQSLASDSDQLDADRLASCTQIDYLARESMRFNPPVPLYFRNVQPTSSVELGGHTLPADTTIFITNVALQREGQHWPNPDDYDPARWENGVAEANPIGSGRQVRR